MLQTIYEKLCRSNVHVKGRDIAFIHRGTESDFGVISQTFENKQYYPDTERISDLNAEYDRIVASGKTPLIIDAGANIGTSTVWFAESYPLSHIVSIEPDAENFSILVLNAAKYSVDFRFAAISALDAVGFLHDPGRGPLGYVTSNDSGGRKILFVGCKNLIDQKILVGMEPFIFKCDIEGGETQLFSHQTDWVNLFYLMVAEPHDWLIKGKASSQNMLRAISQHPRDFIFYGENIFSFRNTLV